MKKPEDLMEKIVSLCKRRGFVYQGSEIYGGLAGTWDYGPLGVALKKNIENLWWRYFVDSREDMYGIDSAILMNPKVWEASGHVSGFSDPLIECKKCGVRFRVDHLLEQSGKTGVQGLSIQQMADKVKSVSDIVCLECGARNWTDVKQFNMMFKTFVGPLISDEFRPGLQGGTESKHDVELHYDDRNAVYLRPETAQGMFVNFKNIVDSYHPKLPFGIAQIGRSFRNEIAPRDFIFRVRELEIMEFEYFTAEGEWEKHFEYWRIEMQKWFHSLGFAPEDIKEVEIPDGERAHYSKRTTDFHFRYPHKFDEIGGLAYRTDFDLTNHIEKSAADLRYLDPSTNEKFVPHVIEPTFGLGRHVLAVIAKAYTEDELGGETRVVLKFPPHLAPVKAAVFPLLKNKPELVAKAREIYIALKKEIPQTMWDDNGNIGKRYRRQDEVGTPWCITIDFDTLTDETVTIRDRDTGTQERVALSELAAFVSSKLQAPNLK